MSVSGQKGALLDAFLDDRPDLQFAAAPQGGVRAFEAFHGHHHALFDHDALVFDNQITRAGIQLPDGTPYLELRCVGFPNFGIWSASQDAPFVCLEPWMGRCDDCGFTGDLSEKPFINHLKMDEMFETAYTIEIF